MANLTLFWRGENYSTDNLLKVYIFFGNKNSNNLSVGMHSFKKILHKWKMTFVENLSSLNGILTHLWPVCTAKG